MINKIVALLIACHSIQAHGSDLSPVGTRADRLATANWSGARRAILAKVAQLGVDKFNESVHEEITNRSYGCDIEGPKYCGDPELYLKQQAVIAGVRWNDDPPFMFRRTQAKKDCATHYRDGRPQTIRFVTQPLCWANVMLDAKKALNKENSLAFDGKSQAVLPLRSHFGDMQFLHSMGAADGEQPSDTQALILGWAEFTWAVAQKEFDGDVWLKDIRPRRIRELFEGSNWRIQDLFSLGDETLRDSLDDVAFGSLLHMVQDGFAAGHVQRLSRSAGKTCSSGNYSAPGFVQEFHSYRRQDADLHAEADTRAAYAASGVMRQVEDAGRVLIKLRKDKADWAAVQDYLLCIYDISPAATVASPGEQFAKADAADDDTE